jgi:hypothetical protein
VYIADINRQLAEGKARAAKDDLEDSLVQAEAENRNGEGFEEGEVYNADARPPQRTVAEFFAARDAKSPESDAPYAPPQSQPGILDEAAPKKQMRVRYVCRNGTWLRTKRLKRFHVGEKVYIKDASGKFEVAGKVNKAGHLPAVYAEESK